MKRSKQMEQSEIIDTQARLIDLLDRRLCKLARLAKELGAILPTWANEYALDARARIKHDKSTGEATIT